MNRKKLKIMEIFHYKSCEFHLIWLRKNYKKANYYPRCIGKAIKTKPKSSGDISAAHSISKEEAKTRSRVPAFESSEFIFYAILVIVSNLFYGFDFTSARSWQNSINVLCCSGQYLFFKAFWVGIIVFSSVEINEFSN